MPVTASPNLGYPIPGATVDDDRQADLTAIKDALLFLDGDASTYIAEFPGNTKTPEWDNIYYWSPKDLITIDMTQTTPILFEVRTLNVPDGTFFDWRVSPISTSDVVSNWSVYNGVFTISEGNCKIVNNFGVIETAITPRTPMGDTEYFTIMINSSSIPLLYPSTKLVTLGAATQQYVTINKIVIIEDLTSDLEIVTFSQTGLPNQSIEMYVTYTVSESGYETDTDFVNTAPDVSYNPATRKVTVYKSGFAAPFIITVTATIRGNGITYTYVGTDNDVFVNV